MVAHSAILDRVIRPKHGDLSPELARHILSLDFDQTDRARYEALSIKAQEGTLTGDEESELDGYLVVNDLLTVLQSKARVSLKQQSSAA